MQRKISVDNMKVDSLQIIEDSKCCLKVNAVITKVGVYDYSDSPVMHNGKKLTMALKSAPELLKATRTARAAKLVVLAHPTAPMPVVTSQSQMKGYIEKPFFDRNKIRAQLNFDKQECPPEFLDRVRNAATKDGVPLDVSVGFYHEVDPTPGSWKNDLSGVDEPYDYVMRNIVIDHVACGVERGRCSYPNCGIGVDAAQVSIDDMLRGRVSRDFQTMEECMTENSDKENPEAFCKWYMQQIGKGDTVQSYIKARVRKDVYVQQDPWEVTEEFVRSGHKEPPSGEGKCRTKVLSESDGIEAIICDYGKEAGWQVQSYLFKLSKGWNKSKAQAWFEKHKGDAMPEENKLKDEFVKMKVKEGSTKEQAEAQYEDLTKPPEGGSPPAGEGEKRKEEEKGKEGEQSKEGEGEKKPEPTAQELIEESKSLQEIIKDI